METLPTAILRHTTPDGLQHFDWLLAGGAVVEAEARETRCWKCPSPLTLIPVDEPMLVEELPRHRGLYLSLDAPKRLDQNRGWVEPYARGLAQELIAPAGEEKCRRFVLRFENAAPIFVRLEGPRLTRLREF